MKLQVKTYRQNKSCFGVLQTFDVIIKIEDEKMTKRIKNVSCNESVVRGICFGLEVIHERGYSEDVIIVLNNDGIIKRINTRNARKMKKRFENYNNAILELYDLIKKFNYVEAKR